MERHPVIERNVTTVTSITMAALHQVAPTVTTASMVVMSAAPTRTVSVQVAFEVEVTTVPVPTVTNAIRPRTGMAMQLFAIVLRGIFVLEVEPVS